MKPGLPPELNPAVGHVLQLRSGPDPRLRASTRGRKERSQPWDVALQVIRHTGGMGKGLTKQQWSLPGCRYSPRHSPDPLAAAACSRLAPRQEASGFWYFLRARLAGGHLYSLDASTRWYSTYSLQAGNRCLSSLSKPFCPKPEASHKAVHPPAGGSRPPTAGRRWG